MKKSAVAITLLCLSLAALLIGAAVLYRHLAPSVDLPQLSVGESVSHADEGGESAALPDPPADTPADTPANTPAGSGETAAENEAEEPLRAPDFTVYTGDGTAVSLSDFLGTPVVINFWASRCAPCRSEMGDFNEVWSETGEEIAFLMVNVTDGSWDTPESAAEFIAENGYAFPVYYDTDLSATAAYAVSSLPSTFFIDAEGCAVAYGVGTLSRDTLLTGIDMIRPQE